MIDIDKQIKYWQEEAKEDWDVALELVGNNRFRHGLFFAHLALEKMLKALVCKETRDLAPKIHNLLHLTQLANISLTSNQSNILTEMNSFNIEGRYTDSQSTKLTKENAQAYIKRAKEMFTWLMIQL
ncbi:MAG: HEPN domain-containing protein [Candidatus Poribacteria bacterium]